MSSKTPVQKKARALQARTGWSYSESLRCIKTMTPEAIEVLVEVRAVEGHPSEGGLCSNEGASFLNWSIAGSNPAEGTKDRFSHALVV